jgi:hypothetical protein
LRTLVDPSMVRGTLMQHDLRFLATATLCVLGACATSGGGPDVVQPRPGITASEYYPLTDGWKWAYDVEQEGTNILATYAVVEVKEKLSVVQAGDERLTYLMAPDGVAQFDGSAIGDYVIKDPLKPGAEWTVAGGRARIASVNEEANIEGAGRYAGCVVVEVTRTEPARITRTMFAPGVGPVAIEMQVQEGPKFVTKVKARLRAVTKPGDALASGP